MSQSQLWVLILRKGETRMPWTVCAASFGEALSYAREIYPDWMVVHADA